MPVSPVLHVGTSGFSYDEWRPAFYPDDLKKDAMLPFYAERLPAVEINNTFYRMPNAKTVGKWRAQVPDGFRFAIKASQRFTWSQKLIGCDDLAGYFWKVLEPLGSTLGCVFYQVPKWVRKDLDVMRAFLALQQAGTKVAFEFAHASWLDDDARALLREHDAAIVVSDRDEEPEPDLPGAATWAYLRLRRSAYDDDALRRWHARLRGGGFASAFVFLKHEDSCAGPALARRFLDLA